MLARQSVRCLFTSAAARGSLLKPACRWASASSTSSGAPTPSPDSRDILDRVALDHRQVEDMFRALRNRESDRAGLMRKLATTLVAHNESEELHFYPHVQPLKDHVAKGSTEVPHEEVEHVQSLVALLAVLEEPDTKSKSWEDKFAVLVAGVSLHVQEEEAKVHNLARTKIPLQQRQQMGDAFVKARDEMISRSVGDVESVRKLVGERASIIQKLKVKLMG